MVERIPYVNFEFCTSEPLPPVDSTSGLDYEPSFVGAPPTPVQHPGRSHSGNLPVSIRGNAPVSPSDMNATRSCLS
jgi:hypothetical protein